MEPTEALKGKRILIVDDHSMNIFALETALTSLLDIHVQSVMSGPEALELLATADHGIDFVLMDMMMPIMNGYEATRKIRAMEGGINSDLTIIAVTARAMQEDREKCMKAGVSDYVRKPVDITALIALLAKHTQH